MQTHSRKVWPLYTLVAVLAILGLFVLDGIAAGVDLFATLLLFIVAMILHVRGEKVYDGVGGIGGPF
jgi:hypothetical protein